MPEIEKLRETIRNLERERDELRTQVDVLQRSAPVVGGFKVQRSGRKGGFCRPLIKAASEFTGISLGELVSHERHRPIIRARQAIMFVARERGRSYPQIGVCFGQDHSTVVHAIRTTRAALDEGHPGITALVEHLRQVSQ